MSESCRREKEVGRRAVTLPAMEAEGGGTGGGVWEEWCPTAILEGENTMLKVLIH